MKRANAGMTFGFLIFAYGLYRSAKQIYQFVDTSKWTTDSMYALVSPKWKWLSDPAAAHPAIHNILHNFLESVSVGVFLLLGGALVGFLSLSYG